MVGSCSSHNYSSIASGARQLAASLLRTATVTMALKHLAAWISAGLGFLLVLASAAAGEAGPAACLVRRCVTGRCPTAAPGRLQAGSSCGRTR